MLLAERVNKKKICSLLLPCCVVLGYPYKQLVSDGAAVMKYLQTRRPPSVQDLKIRKKGLLKTTPSSFMIVHNMNL